MRDTLTILIPVFNAHEDTIECIHSILKSDANDVRIVALNDGSSEFATKEIIAAFKGIDNIEIYNHRANRGYTLNVELGRKLVKTPYFCLINSDTLVPKKWASVLVDALQADKSVAAVGPLSNAASFQNIPKLLDHDGSFAKNPHTGLKDDDREKINLICQHLSNGIYVDLPILNGFCTIFNSEYVEKAGGFDYTSFPTGYGEENDLCIRLAALGYRLKVATDVFVHHKKSKSFGDENKVLFSKVGSDTLQKLYGTRLLPELAKLMKKNTPLNSLRLGVEGVSDALSEIEHITFNGDSDELVFNYDATQLIKIEGGHTYKISVENISNYSAFDGQHHRIGVDEKDSYFILSVPSNLTLNIIGSDPIVSMLAGLSIISSKHIVKLGNWSNQDILSKYSYVTRRLSFDNLYLSDPDLDSDETDTIYVVSPAYSSMTLAPGSTHIRVWERLSYQSESSTVNYVRMLPGEFISLVDNSQPDATIKLLIQRDAFDAQQWRYLEGFVKDGRVKYVFELDDDITHVPFDKDPLGRYARKSSMIKNILENAQGVITSTEYLKNKLNPYNDNIFHFDNKLSDRLWSEVDIERRSDASKTFLYMGSTTHDEDIQMVLDVWPKVMEIDPSFKLLIIGAITNAKMALPDGVEVITIPRSSVNYPDFVTWLKMIAKDVDIALAPLVVSEFNACKSDLKLLDYCALGLPIVSSKHSVYENISKEIPHILTCNNTKKDWLLAIKKAAESFTDDHTIRTKQYEYAHKNKFLTKDVENWFSIIEKLIL